MRYKFNEIDKSIHYKKCIIEFNWYAQSFFISMKRTHPELSKILFFDCQKEGKEPEEEVKGSKEELVGARIFEDAVKR